MSSSTASVMSALERAAPRVADARPHLAQNPITVLIVVPTLDAGAADVGALGLVRILKQAGHRAIVASQAGRLVADVTAAGGEFVPLDLASNNPLRMLRNAAALNRIAREHHCDVIHALGRAAAWSAYLAARLRGIPFVTSWYKGFRDQNVFKHLVQRHHGARRPRGGGERADRAIDQRPLRHAVAAHRGGAEQHRPRRASIRPRSRASASRRSRRAWGVKRDTKVILIVGRIVRRKGHHVVVQAAQRLKEMGLKDFLCVFVGEDRGRTHYTGELMGPGAVDRHHGRDPHGGAGRRHAGRLCRGRGGGFGGGAAGRPATRDPGGAGDGAAGRRLRPRRRPRRRAHAAGGAGRAASPACAFTPATTPRWRRRCCACSPCPSRSAAAIGARGRDWVLGHFNAPRSPSRRCGSMTRSPGATKSRPRPRDRDKIRGI